MTGLGRWRSKWWFLVDEDAVLVAGIDEGVDIAVVDAEEAVDAVEVGTLGIPKMDVVFEGADLVELEVLSGLELSGLYQLHDDDAAIVDDAGGQFC